MPKKSELLDLLPFMVSLVLPAIALMIMLTGMGIKEGNTLEVLHWNDLYPGWLICLFFVGWYATIIITNWMILDYNHTAKNKDG